MPPASCSLPSTSYPSATPSVERAKYATVITLLRGFILLTACFFGLPLLLGDRGIWLATPLAEMLTTLFILVIYISGKKEHKEKSVSLDKIGCANITFSCKHKTLSSVYTIFAAWKL